MGILLVFLLIVTSLVTLLWILAYRDRKYFESRGIPYIGNGIYRLLYLSFKGISISENIILLYNQMKDKNQKVAGGSDFGNTGIMVTDLDLVKHILVKDFDHFANRRQFAMPKNDILLNKMLIALTGEKWKALRSKMSPTFTTGKIRRMFKIFDESSKKLVKYVEQQMEQSGQIDLCEGYSKYTMDVIASAACGIDSEAFNQIESSIFEQMGKKMQLQFNGAQLFKLIFIFTIPKLADMMGLSFFAKDVQQFFSGAIKSSIKQRKENGEIRNDFIQLMLEAREGHLKTEESELEKFEKDAILSEEGVTEGSKVNTAELLDDDGIVANCVLFIVGGFDTTQSLLLFAAYALAINTEVQDRLRSEIESAVEENDGEFTYDFLNKMTYLDMVINETLRFYPPAAATDRGCTKDYKIPGTDFILKKGQGVTIPIFGIHHDDQYYPEPEKFLPERFSVENKSKLNPYAFLPFGHGPRNCIGMRFALAEVKLAIAHLVHNFNIEPSEKTLIPMQYQNSGSLKPLGGMWLALHRRH